jgi:transcription elongation factor Elf1
MGNEDFFSGDEEPEEGPQGWRPPVECPDCGQAQTRFVTLKYGVSVYVCDMCGSQFEVDELE